MQRVRGSEIKDTNGRKGEGERKNEGEERVTEGRT